MASIEFTPGITEVPSNVRVLKSKSDSRSSAIFRFEKEELNTEVVDGGIMSMIMSDEEGEMVCRNIQAKFINGKFTALESIYEMESDAEWERFMRFMERFSAANNMGMGGSPDPAPASS